MLLHLQHHVVTRLFIMYSGFAYLMILQIVHAVSGLVKLWLSQKLCSVRKIRIL